jgi:hypothetical protein
MSQHTRRRQKVDKNQQGIVGTLRKYPGVSVELGYDDLLVGYNLMTFWIEVKAPDAISKRTGLLLESRKKDSQKRLDRTWTGHRAYATTVDEILDLIGYRSTD